MASHQTRAAAALAGRDKPRPYTCFVAACHSTFKRAYEMKRHLKDIHKIFPEGASQESYYCALNDCPAAQRSKTRKDKFQLHIRKYHADNNEEELIRRSTVRSSAAAKSDYLRIISSLGRESADDQGNTRQRSPTSVKQDFTVEPHLMYRPRLNASYQDSVHSDVEQGISAKNGRENGPHPIATRSTGSVSSAHDSVTSHVLARSKRTRDSGSDEDSESAIEGSSIGAGPAKRQRGVPIETALGRRIAAQSTRIPHPVDEDDDVVQSIEVPIVQSAPGNANGQAPSNSFNGIGQASSSRPSGQDYGLSPGSFENFGGGNGRGPVIGSRRNSTTPSSAPASWRYYCPWHDPNAPQRDPTRYCRCRKQFVSQLLKHFECQAHLFFPCDNCFESFESKAELDAHKAGSGICAFKCVTKTCRNYRQTIPFSEKCQHASSENDLPSIWREYFRMQRGFEPPPGAPYLLADQWRSPTIASPSPVREEEPSINGAMGNLFLDPGIQLQTQPNRAEESVDLAENVHRLQALAIELCRLVLQPSPIWPMGFRPNFEAIRNSIGFPSVSHSSPHRFLIARMVHLHQLLLECQKLLDFSEERTEGNWFLLHALITRSLDVAGRDLLGNMVDGMPWQSASIPTEPVLTEQVQPVGEVPEIIFNAADHDVEMVDTQEFNAAMLSPSPRPQTVPLDVQANAQNNVDWPGPSSNGSADFPDGNADWQSYWDGLGNP